MQSFPRMPRFPRFLAAIGGIAVFASVLLVPRVSLAEDNGVADQPQPTEPYANWMLAGYLAAPLLALGSAYALSELHGGRVRDGDAVAGITLGLLLPMSIHVTAGEPGLGVRALLGWPLAMAAGTFAGGVLGLGGALLFYHSSSDEDDGLGALAWVAVGAGLGFVAGAVGWVVFDVDDAYDRDRARRRNSSSLTFGFAPVPHGGALGVLSATF